MTFARRRAEWLERKEAERQAQRQALCFPTVKPLHTGSYEGAVSGQAVYKDNNIHSEAYRRLVASYPCKICGVPHISQAAHPNTGKAAGKKLIDDRECFPLCCDQPGRAGCHGKFDQGALFSKEVRRTLEPVWGRDTRAQIKAAGLWPKGLPEYEEQEE